MGVKTVKEEEREGLASRGNKTLERENKSGVREN